MTETNARHRYPNTAGVFQDLANQKHDGIWKRRQITWRTNFVLWAALVAVTAALYREANLLPSGSWPWIQRAFIAVFVAHAWHWVGAFISDEIAFSWMHYYEQEAEKQLGVSIPEKETKGRPTPKQGWWYHLWKWKTLRKAHAIAPQIIVTGALMAVAMLFLDSKVAKDSPPAHEAAISIQDRLSGENLRIVLEKLPHATQPTKP